MFKRSEKKIKAVFKMQFQATQVPELKSKGLMISLVPVDVGRPTVRLEKAPIVGGACAWESPVYETVKLVQEIKTGRIREKFYYLIVSTGSSKSGFLGEVSIDFADVAEAIKPLNLSLPLQTSKSGAILHVTIQRMQEEHHLRCSEDNESNDERLDAEAREGSNHGDRSLHSYDTEDSSEVNCNESNSGIDSKPVDEEKEDPHEKLRSKVKMLERKAEVSEMELQSLRQQVVKECKKGQQLSEKIIHLRGERDALKAELDGSQASDSVETIRQELQREKHMNKKLKLQLQKTEDSNSEFVLALRDLNKKLEQKNSEISQLSCKVKALQSAAPENQAMDRELELEKKEKEETLMDLKRLTADYENLEHRNNESLNTISELEFQVSRLQKEMEAQAGVFEEELNAVTEAKFEQEQRAVRAEEAYRKARRSNADAAQRLQEEVKQLSANLLSRTEENEKLVQILTAEASDLRRKNEVLQDTLHKAEEEHGMKLEQSKGACMKEKEDLAKELASVKRESEKLLQEHVSIKSQMDQKKTKEENLHLEVKKLRLKNSEMKNQLSRVESEKESLKEEVAKSQEQNGVDNASSWLHEMGCLREKNRSMEERLKEMHERYSEISLKFAEVEGERQQLVMALRNLKNGKKN